MKIKKFLVGAACFFGLTAFSVNVTARNESQSSKSESYTENILKNSKDEKAKKVVSNIYSLFSLFSDYYSVEKDPALKKFIEERFINKNRELKEFNEEDLNKLLGILNSKLEEVEKNYKNFKNIEKTKEFREVYNKYRKKLFNLYYESGEKLTEKQKKEMKEFKNTIGNYSCKEYKNFVSSQNDYVKTAISSLKNAISYIKKIKNNEIPKKQLNEILKAFGKLDIKKIYSEFKK